MTGLAADSEQFRITPNDEAHAGFPTKDAEDSFTLAAYDGEVLAGVVSFTRDGADREKLRHKGILFRMYVAAEFRGKSVGRKLIHELLERVKWLQDIEQINLTVVNNNKRAKGLYERFGFQTFGSEINAIKWQGHYFTEDQMVLQLE